MKIMEKWKWKYSKRGAEIYF